MNYWTVTPEWPGATVFIVGGGPSVASIDLQALRGRRVIVINKSWRAVPFADILIFSDSDFWEDEGRHLHNWPGRIVCLSRTPNAPDRLIKMRRKMPPGLDQPNDCLSVDRTTATGAIDLAVKLGAARIVLLGIDGRKGPDGKAYHHEPYRRPFPVDAFSRHRTDLAMMAKALHARGVECLLGTPSAYSDLWPVVDFQECLRSAIIEPSANCLSEANGDSATTFSPGLS